MEITKKQAFNLFMCGIMYGKTYYTIDGNCIEKSFNRDLEYIKRIKNTMDELNKNLLNEILSSSEG